MKQHKFAILIAIILFFIPFFWLKPGEMNLGGDSGRLYFYDPFSYFQTQTLYSFISSGTGSENTIGYVFIPYLLFLLLLKWIFQSPTILISIVSGLSLSTGFLAIYLSLQELLKAYENKIKEHITAFSSILGGLFYIFSQISIRNGWENELIVHSHIFVNPLMFYLLLRFFLTQKMRYLFIALFTSLIFAYSFSPVSAPSFFAFYPLAITFLFCYVRFVRKLPISYKGIIVGILFFVLLHSFHITSEISYLLSSGSSLNDIVFTQEGISSRGGVDYFAAIASSIKISMIWMSIAQGQKNLFPIFIVFPFILIAGFLFNKGKTLLVTGIFFLIVLFFAAGQITDFGFFLYKQLFRISGFSMFRNYYGQWAYSFIFFYALLFGQAYALVISKVSARLVYISSIIVFLIILWSGWPLINGSAAIASNQEAGLRYAIRMDPVYEKLLSFLRTSPVDGKVISFPLTGPGYQILQGKDGGIYQGLSTISYLIGKSDFNGFVSLKPFHNIFVEYMRKQDFDGIKKILSIMNIRYIYYNSDPFIYSDALKEYLYSYVFSYSPQNQKKYSAFIKKLPVSNLLDFGDKYHIYSIDPNIYLPHIFPTTKTVYTNDQLLFTTDQLLKNDIRTVPLPVGAFSGKNDNVVLYAIPQMAFLSLKENAHFHLHEPYISRGLADPLYALVPLREKYDLSRLKNNHDQYVDYSLLLLTKRLFELIKVSDTVPLLEGVWQEPKLWQIYKWGSYNSWNAGFSRYEKQLEELLNWVDTFAKPDAKKEVYRIKIEEQLYRHQLRLLKGLMWGTKTDKEKSNLILLSNSMFEKFFDMVHVPIYDPSQYAYSLPPFTNTAGQYNVLLETGGDSVNQKNFDLAIQGKKMIPIADNSTASSGGRYVGFKNYFLDGKSSLNIALQISPENIAKKISWKVPGAIDPGVIEKEGDIVKLTPDNSLGESTLGFLLEIPDWKQGNTYLISFDYLTLGDQFLFYFYDKNNIFNKYTGQGYKLYFEKILNSKKWTTHQSIVTATGEPISAAMRISVFSGKQTSAMYVKNLSITQLSVPKIIFERTDQENTENQAPKITFTKINSTKYKIKISGANAPYELVFLESYSNNWKLINPNLESKTIRGGFLRSLGFIGKTIVGFFVQEKNKQETVNENYFNGTVTEGKHKNIFLAPSTFDSWGKSKIADSMHFQTFEYANVWIIKPEDLQGRSEYTLILEMENQKRFYVFACISLITLIILVIYIIRKLIFKK